MTDNDNLLKDIKSMTPKELDLLASKIRTSMVESVSKTGGHLASSLGVVELTLAVHKVFDSPEDKIVWDVGHQTYAHKMITGRWDQMDTLRQKGGISGFPKRTESVHDASDPGHSGTSLSIAMGYATARDLDHKNYNVVAVIGDGALTSGVAIEAIDAISSMKTPLVIILNDNNMSISRNVGGFNYHLQKLRTSDFYSRFKDSLKRMTGPKGTSRMESIRDSLKHLVMPKDILGELGLKYYGPIDGHDIEGLVNMLSFVKTLDKPSVVHVITKKGKGYAPAEADPTRFHGIGSFDLKDPYAKKEDTSSWSYVFGQELLEAAKEDESICAISAAMIDSTGLCPMKDAFPDRVFDTGIAEQHAAAFAEGLALAGKKPVFAVYSTFLQRAYDQLITEVCLQDLPVIFGIDRAGITGRDGETHQGIYDIAYLYTMPGMTVMCPRDRATLRAMLAKALKEGGPVSIRYPKGIVPEYDFPAGDGTPQLLKEGSDVIIISDGNMLGEALKAADLLDESFGKGFAAVADIGTLKPLDKDFLRKALAGYKLVVTVEDGIVSGGFGSIVCTFAEEEGFDIDVLSLGWPLAFIEHGSVSELRKLYKMDAQGIAEKIEDKLKGARNEEKA